MEWSSLAGRSSRRNGGVVFRLSNFTLAPSWRYLTAMKHRVAPIRAVRVRLALFLALGLSTSPALAHSELKGASPANGARLLASPEAIDLAFNERVQVTAVRLFREGGAQAGGEVRLERPRAAESVRNHCSALPALEAGAYRVEWRIISADGHPVGGTLRFTVERSP
jgi:methionine-rich copper-binding protein CopC